MGDAQHGLGGGLGNLRLGGGLGSRLGLDGGVGYGVSYDSGGGVGVEVPIGNGGNDLSGEGSLEDVLGALGGNRSDGDDGGQGDGSGGGGEGGCDCACDNLHGRFSLVPLGGSSFSLDGTHIRPLWG